MAFSILPTLAAARPYSNLRGKGVGQMKQKIGETAGQIWRLLNETGPAAIGRLPKLLGAPSRHVYMALGWLAREDQVGFVTAGGRTRVAVRPQS